MLTSLLFTVSIAVVAVNAQWDAAIDHIRVKGLPLMEVERSLPHSYRYLTDLETLKTYVDQELSEITDVPVGLVPKITDPTILTLCPDLIKKRIISGKNTNSKFYSFEIVDYDLPVPADSLSWDEFYIAPIDQPGYCGASYPLNEIKIKSGDPEETTYYPPRAELIPSGATPKLLGFVWKMQQLPESLEKDITGTTTRMATIFLRQLTSMTKDYQHVYTFLNSVHQENLAKNMYYEPPIALVVSVEQKNNDDDTLQKCPLLQKATLYSNGAINWVGFSPPSFAPGQFTKKEDFYCAPYMGYCAAYLKLMRLPAVDNSDTLITTDNVESELVYANLNKYKAKSKPQQICWVWYSWREEAADYYQSALSTIKSGNVRLARGYWLTGPNAGVKKFGIDEVAYNKLVNSGQVYKAADLGIVALDNIFIKIICPGLIELKIYQEEGGNQRTFIGGNAQPRPLTKGKWVLENTFYCAPYAGYCGATTLLWAMQSWIEYRSIMYTVEYAEVQYYSVDPNYPYRLCWIWDI